MQVPHPVQVENGDIVKLYPGEKPEVYDKAPSGRLYLDGSVSVDPDSQSIKDRKNLSANGYLEVTIMITPKGNIHNNPILSFRGLPVDDREKTFYQYQFSKNLMSATGLAIIYIIIWWIVFFAILPIDVNRTKTVKIDGEDPGSPENPKMLKKFLYCTGITTVIFIIIYLLIKFEYLNLRNMIN